MTKKDYELIARVFNSTNGIWIDARKNWIAKRAQNQNAIASGYVVCADNAINEKIDAINKILASNDVIISGLCFELKKANPKFNEARFKTACGFMNIAHNEVYKSVEPR